MAENILKKLVENSKRAIDDGVYEINEKLGKSNYDFIDIINTNSHPTLLTEVKFSSPSLGKIRTISDPLKIAKQMIDGGSRALSVLTQPHLFNGSPEFFMAIRREVKVPMLMKDIVVDKIQIEAGRKIGADFMLLIQSLFDKKFLDDIDEFVEFGHKNGLKVLLEVHTLEEFNNALKTNADLIGINNRNLDTLEIDLTTTEKILKNFDSSRPIISESGIESPEHIKFLKESGASAFLIGSSIMKSQNIEEHVKKMANAY
ncbi:MAG: indole-3-glycerol phosphate synthase TrpC [Nitrosopumilus sp.]